jgi:hypothetical protein
MIRPPTAAATWTTSASMVESSVAGTARLVQRESGGRADRDDQERDDQRRATRTRALACRGGRRAHTTTHPAHARVAQTTPTERQTSS